MTQQETMERRTRRVRPWIAALLTVLGWGVGFYYARQSKAAFWWAVLQVVWGFALLAGLILYVLYVDRSWLRTLGPEGGGPLPWISWGITIVVAIIAWIVASRHREVERAGAGRLFGYFLIILVPIVVSLVAAMALRFTTYQPFRSPSGSMQPTIHVGDYVLANKFAYGYSRYSAAPLEGLFPAGRLNPHQPQRGDIVVFRPTPEPNRDFVKRVVGLPGDRIQMIGGRLNINGQPVARELLGALPFMNEDGQWERLLQYRETLPNGVSYVIIDRTERGELDNTRVFVVPPNNYFMLGDDRDNSADSRVPSVMGYVPFDNLVGRIDYIFGGPDVPSE